jgi:hypothetical protein
LLSSLLVQLCDQYDAYYGVLSHFYLEHGSGEDQASDSELSRCLKEMLGLPEQPIVHRRRCPGRMSKDGQYPIPS